MNKYNNLIKTINSTLLCLKYPFLKHEYDKGKFFVNSCWYFAVSHCWRYIFLQMCEEIKRTLKREGKPYDYFRIYDINEDDGVMEINCSGGFDEDVTKIVEKYEYISFHTCIKCGRQAYGYASKWVAPYCKECGSGIDMKPFYTEEDDWYGYTRWDHKQAKTDEQQEDS